MLCFSGSLDKVEKYTSLMFHAIISLPEYSQMTVVLPPSTTVVSIADKQIEVASALVQGNNL